jgi:hypothetical protein
MQLATSYFGCRIPRHVKRDVKRLRELGFTRVIHTFSENDFRFYADTMREIVAITQEAGLEVLLDPWGVGRVFGGEAFSHWITEDPDLMQRNASGRPLGAACLNNPGLQSLMHAWTDAAAATGARWVFWDEPHWSPKGPSNPAGERCACEHCRVRARGAGEAPDWDHLRARWVVDFLGDMATYASDRGLQSSICVLPRDTLGQPPLDWAEIAALPGVGEFGTDPYWQAFGIEERDARDAFIDTNAVAAHEAAERAGVPVMLWLQAFRIEAAKEQDLQDGTRRLLQHAPQTVAIWGFEACAHMSSLACDHPRRVWRSLIRLCRER